MTRSDKVGITVLVALFLLLMAALAWTLKGAGRGSHDIKDSPIIKQRITNVQKSR